MKKAFSFGVITGCCISLFALLGYYAITISFSKKNIPHEVQRQIAENIQDTKQLIEFAENTLAEYSSQLYQSRELLVNLDGNESSSNAVNGKITQITEKALLLIETAQFNSHFIFTENDGKYILTIPVTLDATTPTYKLNISTEGFNRKSINTFISNLSSNNSSQDFIEELDNIISSITLERSKLDAYQKKLTYSYKVALVLTMDSNSEINKELKNIQHQIMTDKLVLSIKSANGIYTFIDRKQMQNQFDELDSEQLRICTLLKKSIPKKGKSNFSLLTQAEAEKAMLNLIKLNT